MTRRLNLTRVPRERRQETWEWLQREYPDQAAWVEDPLVQEMRRHFNAEIVIHLPEKADAKGA